MVVALLLEPMVPLGDVNLAADDGFYARMLLGVLEELLDAVHVAMVRDGQAGHAQLFRALEKIVDGRLTVQDGILGVNV